MSCELEDMSLLATVKFEYKKSLRYVMLCQGNKNIKESL